MRAPILIVYNGVENWYYFHTVATARDAKVVKTEGALAVTEWLYYKDYGIIYVAMVVCRNPALENGKERYII